MKTLLIIIPLMMMFACTKDKSAEDDHIISKTDEKIEFYTGRIEIDPKAYAYHNRLAQAYIQKARETGEHDYYQKAEESSKKSLILSPDNYVGLVNMALLNASEHNFRDAHNYAKRASDLYPAKSYAYGVLGDACLELGQLHDAEVAYNKMAELDPGLDSYSRLSNLRLKQGNRAGAAVAMEKAYEFGFADAGTSKENLAWTQVMLGSIYLDKGEDHKAQEYFESALEILPGYFLAHEYLEKGHVHSHNF